MSSTATHIRNKTGKDVIVERQYGTLIVRNLSGKFIGSYERGDMAKFYKRYTSKVIKGR